MINVQFTIKLIQPIYFIIILMIEPRKMRKITPMIFYNLIYTLNTPYT